MPTSESQSRSIKLLICCTLALALFSIALSKPDTPDPPGRPLLEISPQQVLAFRDQLGETELVLVHQEDGWQQMLPRPARAASDAVDGYLGALTSIERLRRVDVQGVDFLRTINVETKSGESLTIEVGRRAPGAEGNYVRIGTDTWITATPIPPPVDPEVVLDKRVLTFKRHEIQLMQLENMELEHSRAGWRVRSSDRWKMAKQSDVEAFIDALLDLRVETFDAMTEPVSAQNIRGLGPDKHELASATVTTDAPWMTRLSDNRWVPMTSGLAPWVGHPFAREAVFEFDPELVNRVTVSTNSGQRSIDTEVHDVSRRLLDLRGLHSPDAVIADNRVTVSVHLAGTNHVHAVDVWWLENALFAVHGEDFEPIRLDIPSTDALSALIEASSL